MGAQYSASCECGFSGTYSSAAYADRARRVHSCAKWREKLAGQQRRAERMSKVDRTPKPCTHKQARHEHGTRACYVLDRCRCEPCAKANAACERGRARQKAYGRYDKYVSADPVRAHVRELMAQGMGWKRVALAAGLSPSSMWKLLYGKRRPDGSQTPTSRITKANADRLLAVELDLADGAPVDGTGTRRRLQALVALGYSMNMLGREVGVLNIHLMVTGEGLVMKANADKVREVYDRLSMRPHTPTEHKAKIAASRARNRAKAEGWLPPLAWDDERIDDPAYTPVLEKDRGLAHVEAIDEAAVLRRMDGDKSVRLSKADAAELVRRCRAAGWGWNDIEQRTGVKPDRYAHAARLDVAS